MQHGVAEGDEPIARHVGHSTDCSRLDVATNELDADRAAVHEAWWLSTLAGAPLAAPGLQGNEPERFEFGRE